MPSMGAPYVAKPTTPVSTILPQAMQLPPRTQPLKIQPIAPVIRVQSAAVRPGGAIPSGNERTVMWNVTKKLKVCGMAAPMQKNLAEYLRTHPECEVYDGQDLLLTPAEKAARSKHFSLAASSKKRASDDTTAPTVKRQKIDHDMSGNTSLDAAADPSAAAEELALLLAEDMPDFAKDETAQDQSSTHDSSSLSPSPPRTLAEILDDDMSDILSDDISSFLTDMLE